MLRKSKTILNITFEKCDILSLGIQIETQSLSRCITEPSWQLQSELTIRNEMTIAKEPVMSSDF
jgi:hypothetical protein